jgi:hypothetical protein
VLPDARRHVVSLYRIHEALFSHFLYTSVVQRLGMVAVWFCIYVIFDALLRILHTNPEALLLLRVKLKKKCVNSLSEYEFPCLSKVETL